MPTHGSCLPLTEIDVFFPNLSIVFLEVKIEEGSIGGFGSHVGKFLSDKNLLDNNLKYRSMILPDRYIDHDKPEFMYKYAGLDASSIEAKVLDTLNSKVIIKKTN